MFSDLQRNTLLSDLTETTRGMKGIQGLILVGSGAYGFRDRYSDLDVVVVVEESSLVPSVHSELASLLKRSQAVLKHKVYQHEPDIFVSCFLLGGYLELDLGVWSFEKLRATKPHWKVLYDKNSPLIEERLQQSIPSMNLTIEKTARESMSYIWQFIRSAAVALQRGHLIRAFKDTEHIRDKIAELIALREGILYDVGKEIGKVKSERLLRLVETYEGSMDQDGVRGKLMATVQLYFEELIDIIGVQDTVEEYKLSMDMLKKLTGEDQS